MTTTNSATINNLVIQAELAGLKAEATTTVDAVFETIQLKITTGVDAHSNGLEVMLSLETIFVTAVKMHIVKGSKFTHSASKFGAFSKGEDLQLKSVKYAIQNMASSLSHYNSSKVGA